MQQFEFRIFKGDDDGNVAAQHETITRQLSGDSAARAAAGRMCKHHNGPVDLAYAGGAAWEERYITTAMPSEHHEAGYRLEKLS